MFVQSSYIYVAVKGYSDIMFTALRCACAVDSKWKTTPVRRASTFTYLTFAAIFAGVWKYTSASNVII